jgi:hypothetical protein
LPPESARANKRFFRDQVPTPAFDALARSVYRENCEGAAAQTAFARFAR